MAANKVLKEAWRLVRKVLKAPWEITGVASHPEYKSAIPSAMEYRRFGPATPPVTPEIPQGEPERVYDIKYYTRDRRRSHPQKTEFYFDPHNPEHLKFLDYMPPGPKKWVMSNAKDVYDERENPDGGYVPPGGYAYKIKNKPREN